MYAHPLYCGCCGMKCSLGASILTSLPVPVFRSPPDVQYCVMWGKIPGKFCIVNSLATCRNTSVCSGRLCLTNCHAPGMQVWSSFRLSCNSHFLCSTCVSFTYVHCIAICVCSVSRQHIVTTYLYVLISFLVPYMCLLYINALYSHVYTVYLGSTQLLEGIVSILQYIM